MAIFVPDKLRAARQQFGMSQNRLAERTGHQRTTVIDAEKGHVNPNLATLADYAAVLMIELHEFFDMTGVDLWAEDYAEMAFHAMPDADLEALAEALTRRAAVRRARRTLALRGAK